MYNLAVAEGKDYFSPKITCMTSIGKAKLNYLHVRGANPFFLPEPRNHVCFFISLIRMRSKRDIKMGRLCTPGGAVLRIVGGGVTFRFFNW